MSKRIIYLLLAVSLGLNVGVITTTLVHRKAGPPPGPPPGGGGQHPGQHPDPARLVEDQVRGMTRHLDLTDDQQQAIRTVLERHAEEMIELQIAAADAGRRLVDAYAAPGFDPDAFRQLTAETSAARSRLDSLSAVVLVAEAALLTPEQRVMFSKVAPTIHSRPQPPPRPGGPPHEGGPPPR